MDKPLLWSPGSSFSVTKLKLKYIKQMHKILEERKNVAFLGEKQDKIGFWRCMVYEPFENDDLLLLNEEIDRDGFLML